LHDFVCLSSLLKAYKIFEKSLQKFEMVLKMKFEKKKKKKENSHPYLSGPDSPAGPLPSFPFPFLLQQRRQVGPTCQPPTAPLPFFFLAPAPAAAARRGIRSAPPLPLPSFPPQACQLRQVTAVFNWGPFPLSLHQP
jgi:hypothetical protein